MATCKAETSARVIVLTVHNVTTARDLQAHRAGARRRTSHGQLARNNLSKLQELNAQPGVTVTLRTDAGPPPARLLRLADQAARSVGGYLATLTDSTEDLFVAFTIADPEVMWAPPVPGEAGGIKGPWVGGQRREVDCDLTAMVWVTGETWDYTRWHPGTPSEDCTSGLQLWDRTGQRAWVDNEDDDPTRSAAYIIEWSADCNGDGIVDYGQILDGTFSDDDGNGVPDC